MNLKIAEQKYYVEILSFFCIQNEVNNYYYWKSGVQDRNNQLGSTACQLKDFSKMQIFPWVVMVFISAGL